MASLLVLSLGAPTALAQGWPAPPSETWTPPPPNPAAAPDAPAEPPPSPTPVAPGPTLPATATASAAPAQEPEATQDEDEDEDTDEAPHSGFAFGSYGRVVAASDLQGAMGSDADIVAHGPRIDESVYAELELRREDDLPAGMHSRVVATLALGGPFFHLDGQFDESIAVRNLFAEVESVLTHGLRLWAGSRMVRGDDIYLLDFWPLDNLNTIGGGAAYDSGDHVSVELTFGLARPNDPFQHQTTTTLSPSGFLPSELVVLDRPRFVLAGKATAFPFGRAGDRAIKASLYGEGHFLSSGNRQLDGGGIEHLPSETGYVLGAQVGGWQVSNHGHLNLFFRYARGLAAFDPLGVPFRPGEAFSTDLAREIQLGLSGNYERGAFGLQLGAYYRNFRSASPGAFDGHRLAEGVVVARPMVWFGEQAGVAAEVSYQAMQTTRLDEVTGRPVRGGVTKLGLIPFVSPFGRGTYTRPQLRLIYSLTLRDADARRLYPVADPRSRRSAEHFLGIGAEWWFDSSSYAQ